MVCARSMQYAISPAGGFRLKAPAGTFPFLAGSVSVIVWEPTKKPVAVSGSAFAAVANMSHAPNKLAARTLECNDCMNVFSSIVRSCRSLSSNVCRLEYGRASKLPRQVVEQTRGQELRGKNDEELGPRAQAIVNLTDSAPHFAAIVACVRIEFVDRPSA